MARPTGADLIRVQRERDLYLQLLNLGHRDAMEPFLDEALRLVAEVVQAERGHLELYDDEDGGGARRWSIAHGFSEQELQDVRAAISRGIIAEAVATGETIVSQSALCDRRFRERDSVISGRIGAVLCAPIGDDPPRGVLYLQERAGAASFSEEDRERAELFARHLAPLVDRLVAGQRQRDLDGATQRVQGMVRIDLMVATGVPTPRAW